MHPLLDYDCLLPESVNITDGKVSDNRAAFDIDIHPFSIVVADRGYCDYSLLSHWDSNSVFFVVRHKDNIRYKSIEELPLPEKHAQNVQIDEIIEFELPSARAKYPNRSRRIAYGTINMALRWCYLPITSNLPHKPSRLYTKHVGK